MTLSKLHQRILVIGIVAGLVLGALFVVLYPRAPEAVEKPFAMETNQPKDPTDTFVVALEPTEEWQFAAAACFAPVTVHHHHRSTNSSASAAKSAVVAADQPRGGSIDGHYTPLFFTTGEALPAVAAKYPNQKDIAVADLGDDASAVSLALAKQYWSDLRLVVMVEDYEAALQATPLASALGAPLIYPGSGVASQLAAMGVTSAIIVGENVPDHYRHVGFGVKTLATPAALWEFYLGLDGVVAEAVDYLVVANPHDIDARDERLMLHGLSLTAGVLAAHYHALVVTGEYTVDQNWTQALGFGTGEAGAGERGEDEDTVPDELEVEYQTNIARKAVAMDNAIDDARLFLADAGGTLQYVALVGGPAALPMLYLKSPIWFEGVDQEEKGEEYVATDAYYSDTEIQLTLDNGTLAENFYETADEVYTYELHVGRIIGPTLVDTSALVARSIGYWEYEFKGEGTVDYYVAEIINSLMCGVSDTGAAAHQKALFAQNMIYTELFHPWKVVLAHSFDEASALAQMERVNALIYDGHGYPDGWYHLWTSTHDNSADWDRIGAEDIWDLALNAMPVFGACCLSSALDWPYVWVGAENEQAMEPSSCISLAFIHAGAMCYIGATEESWGSFFGGLADGDPDRWGYGDFDMPTMFWGELLDGETSIGAALSAAKETFYAEEWQDDAGRPFARLCLLETVLYGDPGAMVYSPGMSIG